MRKIFTVPILILLLLTGCEKSELVQLDLRGSLKGTIYTRDESGYRNSDNGNVAIRLEGSDPLLSAISDGTGQFEIKDIPSGTYNLIISKEGYGEYQGQGIQIVGGNVPLYVNYSLLKISGTIIENFSLEIVNGSEIFMNGIVRHNFPVTQPGFGIPAIRYFISNTDNPSGINYLQTGIVSFNGESGSLLRSRINVNKSSFPSGGKIYVVAYGCYAYETGYYDILSNQYHYTSLGTASDIAGITTP